MIAFGQHKDNRNAFQKAADDVSDGLSNASREFKDKSPTEKVGDAVKDAGQKIKDSTN